MNDKNFTGSIDLDECCTLLYQRYGKAVVDEVMGEVGQSDAADEKSVSFSKFVEIQKRAAKKCKGNIGSGLKLSSDRMVPQVKELTDYKDPTLAHLM